MRELTDHKTNFQNKAMKVEVLDDDRQDQRTFLYKISGYDWLRHDSMRGARIPEDTYVLFQRGMTDTCGCNGVTPSALLSVLIDHVRGEQAVYPFPEQAAALNRLEEALMWLGKQNHDRVNRETETKLRRSV